MKEKDFISFLKKQNLFAKQYEEYYDVIPALIRDSLPIEKQKIFMIQVKF